MCIEWDIPIISYVHDIAGVVYFTKYLKIQKKTQVLIKHEERVN